MTSDKRMPKVQYSIRQIVILGPRMVPQDILDEGLLTKCEHRDIALEHITRTAEAVFHLQIVKRS